MESLFIQLLTLLVAPWLWLRPRISRSPKPESVLVIQLGKLGDMVCTTPLFRSLKEHGLEVTVLCLGGGAVLLQNNPHVDRVMVADQKEFLGFKGRMRLLFIIYAAKFQYCISVLPGTWNAVIGLWSCAPVSIHSGGGRMGVAGYIFHFLHTHRVTYAKGARTFDHYMKLAEYTGAKPVAYEHQIFLTDEEQKQAERWLEERGVQRKDRFAVLSVSAGNKLKEWPLDRFAKIADHIVEAHKMQALFSSADTTMTAQALSLSASDMCIDAGGLGLRQLCAVIARASLFVSVDTGPLYIAHAFNVPLIDIIGPVDPQEQPPIPGTNVGLVLPPGIAPTSFVAETLRVPLEEQWKAIDLTTVDMAAEAVDQLLR